MSAKIKRTLRSEFGPRKELLPRSLAFLADVNFIAVSEQVKNERKQVVIEISSASLKNIVTKAAGFEQCVEENSLLEHQIRALEKELSYANAKIELLEKKSANLEMLRRNIEADGNFEQHLTKSPKSCLQIAEEKGCKPVYPPLTGGLPS